MRVNESVSADAARGAQGGFARQSRTTAAGVRRWLSVHDELLRGVAHTLSNRLGTLEALIGLLDAGIMPDQRLVGGLRDDAVQLDGLLQTLRQLPRRDDAGVEPMLLGDAVDLARHLVREHPRFRPGDLHGELRVEARGDVLPVRADPQAVAHAAVVAVLAAGRAGGPVVVILETVGDTVQLRVDIGAVPEHTQDGLERAEPEVETASESESDIEADVAAIAWLLASSKGQVLCEGQTLGFALPTLAASRRAR